MSAIDDIAAERQRQMDAEGWTPEHDDQHEDESLAAAAACYAYPFQINIDGFGVTVIPSEAENEIHLAQLPVGWPDEWDADWWKPSDRRRDLVKAGALIAAEIDRLDRLEKSQS